MEGVRKVRLLLKPVVSQRAVHNGDSAANAAISSGTPARCGWYSTSDNIDLGCIYQWSILSASGCGESSFHTACPRGFHAHLNVAHRRSARGGDNILLACSIEKCWWHRSLVFSIFLHDTDSEYG